MLVHCEAPRAVEQGEGTKRLLALVADMPAGHGDPLIHVVAGCSVSGFIPARDYRAAHNRDLPPLVAPESTGQRLGEPFDGRPGTDGSDLVIGAGHNNTGASDEAGGRSSTGALLDVGKVARRVVEAIQRGRSTVRVGRTAQGASLMYRFAPSLYTRAMVRRLQLPSPDL